MQHKKVIAAAVVGALAVIATGQASALEVYNDKGWKLDISGSMNAFYTSTKTDGAANRSASVENGLLPGYINFTASTQQNGWDVKGVIGYWPGINSDTAATGTATAGVGKSHTDVRTNFLSFGRESTGTFKLGRDIGLFQRNAILNDMTLIGVGGGAGLARAINTTLGGIGAGYIYTEFQPQITYTSPKLGPVSLNFGIFDSKDTASGTSGPNAGYQGLAEIDVPMGKAWVGFVQQKFEVDRQTTARGYEVGGKMDIGPVGLMAQGFSGEGTGDGVLFSNGFDGAGNKRDSDGYLVQATFKATSDLKLGINVGQSKTDGTTAEGGGVVRKVAGRTLGAYYSLTPSVTLVGELNTRQDKLTNIDTDTVSAGAILFF